MKDQPRMSVADTARALTRHPFARQAPSTLGRIAFWGFLIGGLGGLGGTIALTLSLGAPSRDIVITTICSLAGAAVLATRFRWAPLVATLLGAYLLYLVFTEPFVVESLANPKGPNGGFGHFARRRDRLRVRAAGLRWRSRRHGPGRSRRRPSRATLAPGRLELGGGDGARCGAHRCHRGAARAHGTPTPTAPTVHLSAATSTRRR